MIAEEYDDQYRPLSSIPKGTFMFHIISAIKKTPAGFRIALTNPKLKKPLNENKLTQIFVEQINAWLLEAQLPILAQNQYSDIFLGTRGIPDFYFHKVEMGSTSEPLFVVEAKILPSPPPKTREKEYVVGLNKNGGIERFKWEKHGKGLSECGMVGFIESDDKNEWQRKINGWILDMTKIDTIWQADEVLNELENEGEFIYLQSIAHTIFSKDTILYHFLIK